MRCNVARKKVRKNQVEEADWQEYFTRIQRWCPWSYQAYTKGKIEFRRYQGQFDFTLGEWEARVWLVDRKPRLLKKWHKHLNLEDPRNEWLWSHPQYGGLSTPQPCLIQQPRQRLQELRAKSNIYSDNKDK